MRVLLFFFCGALFVVVCGVGVLFVVVRYALFVAYRCCCALCVLSCVLVGVVAT